VGNTVNLVNGEGQSIAVPVEQAADLLASNQYHLETGTDVANRAQANADEQTYGGVAGAVVAGGAALASGASGGLTDAGIAALGGGEQLHKLREHHQALSTGMEIAGTLLPTGIGGLAGRAGGAAAKVFENGVAGAIARGVVEGGIYGAGSGVSQVALSTQPLDAEHIASTLSSNMLLGAGTGGVAGGVFKAGEKALERAGSVLDHASATRAAIEGVPADLAHLDAKGLRDAYREAEIAHKADIVAERNGLESVRRAQRSGLAGEVQDLADNLATERPIFSALSQNEELAPALKGIEGVSDARVRLAKSYTALRSFSDKSEDFLEKNVWRMEEPLRQRAEALEMLQAKIPDIHAAYAGDARADLLSHVPDALKETKAQIAAIQKFDSKLNPVAGGRLATLEAGPSQRMRAIEAAQDALSKAPELGLAAKGAKGAAFAGVTALAHMIPGVGIAAPFLGKAASDFVGTAMQRLSGAAGSVAEKSQATLKAFLNASHKAEKFVPTTATKVLSAVKFGAGPEAKSGKLHDLYAARSAEIRQQTMYAPDGSVQMRPEARMAMAKKLDPIRAVNPLLADQIETTAARKVAFVSSKLPRKPEIGGLQIGPDNWRPSDLQMRSWARTVRAVEDPSGVEERLLHGNMTPEDAEAYRTVYPERFAAMQQAIFEAAPTLAKTLPMKRKIALSVFTGVPLIPALQPNVLAVLQGNFAAEPGSAGGTQSPGAEPQFGKLGSLKSSDKPTPAQQRESA
jgi:hypothetical protein